MERVAIVTIAALAAFAGSVDAQLCAGSASFVLNPYQVSGSALFNDNAKSFSAGFGFGGKGAFGGINLGKQIYDGIDGSSTLYGAGARYQVALDQTRLVQLCPTASVGFLSGPNNVDVFGDGSFVIDVSETDFSFGLGLGILASRVSETQIIPNLSLGFVSGTAKVHDDVSGVTNSQSETWGLLGLGLGFVFSESVTLHPGVSIPFGLDNASITFGLTLAVNFGGKLRTQ